MKGQAFNPYLPSYEYVPDGEPYVFGQRLYVFGSHDAFGVEHFCVNDYVCWSAPTDDLSDWRYEGVIYKKTQDPLNATCKSLNMNAPDVAIGADGRYYLYYQLDVERVTSVAVAERPEGPYRFYGHVHYEDGTLYGNRRGDAFNFDPAVLVDDDGKVYMYTGFSPDHGVLRWGMMLRGGTFNGGSVVELRQDMVTIIGRQKATIPGAVRTKGTDFEGHGFFEASSIRKINGIYYLVYSSTLSHELCYATSSSPVGPWKYGGTLISIGDIGLPGVSPENPRNFIGNTHGGMVCVKDQWYIFYHRQTNQQMCCRQGCAEPITIEADGSIRQAEMTSCGLNGGPLRAEGTYEARIACNLWGAKGNFAYVKPRHQETEYPYFTQSGTDRDCDPDQYIANLNSGAKAGFKYFDFNAAAPEIVGVRTRGGGGKMLICTEEKGKAIAEIQLKPVKVWTEFSAKLPKLNGKLPLYFQYDGNETIDFMSFSLYPARA